MLQELDLSILHYVTQFYGNATGFDWFVVTIAQNDLVKGGPIVALLWWYWFKPDIAQQARREIIVACVIGALVAAYASRHLANLWIVHQRPVLVSGLHLPHTLPALWDDKAGSLPSDHAALAAGLVTGILLISRRVGACMVVYALLLIGLPRVYLGIHWPSDILAGALLGAALTMALASPSMRARIATPTYRLAARSPHVFYAIAFLVSFGLMTRFDSARALVSWAKTSVQAASTVVAVKE